MYSGGLGILAGDHLKSASDLGLPLVGVGLCYRVGYMRQYLNRDGWQQETHARERLLQLADDAREAAPTARRYMIQVELPRPAGARPGSGGCRSGGSRSCSSTRTCSRTRPPIARSLTSSTAATARSGLKQEILLGIGGVRALAALGHRADRLPHERRALGLPRPGADRAAQGEARPLLAGSREAVHASTVFTTHTPVPAGNDIFTPELMRTYFSAVRRPGRHDDGRAPGARPPGSRRHQRRLLHAGARAPHHRPRQRREPAPRPGLAPDVAADLARRARARDPDRPHHERHPHLVLVLERDRAPLRSLPRPALVRGADRPSDLGASRSHPGLRALAEPGASAGAGGGFRAPAAARPARAPGSPRNGQARERGARSRGAHDRLRPAVRHLQARNTPLPRSGAAGPDPQPHRSADPVHLRRQGASQGPPGQGADPGHHPHREPG